MSWIVAMIVWIVVVVVVQPVSIVVPGVIANIPVPIVPRVVRIAPARVVEWINTVAPAIVPWRGIYAKCHVGSAPRAKHRGDILRLNPHLIARYHNVI